MIIPQQIGTCKLNPYTDQTKEVIHLMVTSMCLRNCKYCCNKFYDLNDIPQVTDEELRAAHTIGITGGEPFVFSNPSKIAHHLHRQYPNIKNVFVYTNAKELRGYLTHQHGSLNDIQGLNVSIKNTDDKAAFEFVKNHPDVMAMGIKNGNNRLYVFNGLIPDNPKYFKIVEREWQDEFVPADDSIFRRI